MDIFSVSKNEKSNNKFKLLVCVNLRNVELMFCEGRMALLSNFFNCNWITTWFNFNKWQSQTNDLSEKKLVMD